MPFDSSYRQPWQKPFIHISVTVRTADVLGLRNFPLLLILLACSIKLPAKDATLAQELQAEVEHSRFKHAHLGIKVIALPSGRVVFDHQGDKLFRPASNAKLFTGALVLDRFDPGHRLQTSCYVHARPDASGVVNGDLIIYGRGDPSFSQRFHGRNADAPFKAFAKAIHAAGVRRVTGRLIADESYFNVPAHGSGWTWDELGQTYAAEVSALSVNDNIGALKIKPGTSLGAPGRVTLRPATVPFEIINRTTTIAAGQKDNLYRHRLFQKNQIVFAGQLHLKSPGRSFGLTVHRPARWFGQLLQRELISAGVQIDGPVEIRNHHERMLDPRSGTLVHIASVASPTLLEITRVMMKESQNLYAQLLLLQVGMKTPVTGKNTEAAAIENLDRFVGEIGIPAEEVRMEEGSGLSRRTLLSPNALTKLLQHMSAHPRAKEFASTLTIAGRDGTLSGRMKNTTAANNLRGKTGSLNGTKALSAYVTNRRGQKLAFSILLNNHSQSGDSAKIAIDRIAVKIANSSERFEKSR